MGPCGMVWTAQHTSISLSTRPAELSEKCKFVKQKGIATYRDLILFVPRFFITAVQQQQVNDFNVATHRCPVESSIVALEKQNTAAQVIQS